MVDIFFNVLILGSEFMVHLLLVGYQVFVDRMSGEGTIPIRLVLNITLHRLIEDY